MNRLYVLVGVPASGKSTWVANQDWTHECEIVSTDHFVEQYAKEQGKTYSEVFDDYMPFAVELMLDNVERARIDRKDIIWDQTSTSIKSRATKIRMLPDYYKIAVVFDVPELDELQRRLASRPGKDVPWNVVERMIAGWQMPTEEEGFDEIWYT
jgi:predicted kinase